MAGRVDTPDTFAADLLKAAVAAPVLARAIVKKGAQNIKTESRKTAVEHAPVRNAHAPFAITYDSKIKGPTVSAEIGYDKDLPGGELGNLLEFGGGGDHSPPHLDLARAQQSEVPRFEDALADMGTRLLL